MRFENILDDINGFGRFQIMIVVINFVGRFSLPCHFLLSNFIAFVPAHRCNISSLDDGGLFRNLSLEDKIVVSIPVQEDRTPNSCLMFAEPQYHLLLNDTSNTTHLRTVPCQNGWVYDNSTFKSTLTSQWNLVCDGRGKNKATATIFFIGAMFGGITFGMLSDRFGRRITVQVAVLWTLLFAVGSAFSTTYVMFMVLRFFTGFGSTGILIITTVLSLEWVDIKHRNVLALIDGLSWSFANTALAGIAYFVTDWRWLTFIVTSPLILVILFMRWLPESARWLIANGKHEQALIYLKKCAKMNQTENSVDTLTKETLSTIVETEKRGRTYSILDLVRTPKMRKLALRTGIMWFCMAATFFGINFNIAGFWLNIYFTQFAYSLIEVPAKVAVYFLLDKVGRRFTVMGTLLLVAFCLAINIVIPKEMSVVRTVVAVTGKGFSAAAHVSVILFCSELYPTVVRQIGLGYSSCMARLGIAVAPFILFLDEVWTDLPQVVLISFAILGIIMAKTLSETRNRGLSETIEEIELR